MYNVFIKNNSICSLSESYSLITEYNIIQHEFKVLMEQDEYDNKNTENKILKLIEKIKEYLSKFMKFIKEKLSGIGKWFTYDKDTRSLILNLKSFYMGEDIEFHLFDMDNFIKFSKRVDRSIDMFFNHIHNSEEFDIVDRFMDECTEGEFSGSTKNGLDEYVESVISKTIVIKKDEKIPMEVIDSIICFTDKKDPCIKTVEENISTINHSVDRFLFNCGTLIKNNTTRIDVKDIQTYINFMQVFHKNLNTIIMGIFSVCSKDAKMIINLGKNEK